MKVLLLLYIIFLFINISSVYAAADREFPYDAYISGYNINVREEPGLDSRVLGSFKYGAPVGVINRTKFKVKIYNSYEYWFKIKKFGWVYGQFVSKEDVLLKRLKMLPNFESPSKLYLDLVQIRSWTSDIPEIEPAAGTNDYYFFKNYIDYSISYGAYYIYTIKKMKQRKNTLTLSCCIFSSNEKKFFSLEERKKGLDNIIIKIEFNTTYINKNKYYTILVQHNNSYKSTFYSKKIKDS